MQFHTHVDGSYCDFQGDLWFSSKYDSVNPFFSMFHVLYYILQIIWTTKKLLLKQQQNHCCGSSVISSAGEQMIKFCFSSNRTDNQCYSCMIDHLAHCYHYGELSIDLTSSFVKKQTKKKKKKQLNYELLLGSSESFWENMKHVKWIKL